MRHLQESSHALDKYGSKICHLWGGFEYKTKMSANGKVFEGLSLLQLYMISCNKGMFDDIRIQTLKVNFVVFFFVDFLFSTTCMIILMIT